MAIRIETDNTTMDVRPPSTIRVVKLSISGMLFSYGSRLPSEEILKLSMHLGPNQQEVSIKAEVATCVEKAGASADARYATQLTFKDLDKQTEDLLEQHIDFVFQQTRVLKELPYRQSA